MDIWSHKPLQPPFGNLSPFCAGHLPQFTYCRALHPDCNQRIRAIVLFVLKKVIFLQPSEFKSSMF